jgi:NhaP-type Na+/H+ or K+/H+ antiporter
MINATAAAALTALAGAVDLGSVAPLRSETGSDDGATEIIHVVLLLVIGGVLLSMSLEAIQHRYHITWLPGPATAVIIGLLLGVSIRLSAEEGEIPDEIGFSGEVFFLVLLPMIIFQAGYSLRKKEFFGQLFSILVFSIVGTAISAFTIGIILYGAGANGYSLPLSFNEAMSYASILSATDAVAVANVYRALEADPLLTIMIYGEGSVNDAASIVLYQTFSSFIEEGVTDEGVATAGEHFAAELFGSVGLGIFLAVVATYLFRVVHMGWIPSWITRTCPCCPRSRTGPARGTAEATLLSVGAAYETAPLLGGPITPIRVPGGKTASRTSRADDGNGAGVDGAEEAAPASPSVVEAPASGAAAHGARAAAILRTPGAGRGFGSSASSALVSALARDQEIKPDSSVFAQTSFVLAMGYVSYMAAEACHLSGVVAVLFTGIGLNHFVRPLMTAEGKNFSEGTVRVLAELADMACFFQVGLDMALNFATTRGIDTKADASLVGFVLLGLILGRAIAIFGLSLLLNYYRRKPVPMSHQVMLWHAGLRGAGAYAFTLVFPTHNKDVLVDITAAVVLITVLTCGATTTTMLTWNKVPWGGHHNHDAGHTHTHTHLGSEAAVPFSPVPLSGEERRGYKIVHIQGARVYVPTSGLESDVTRRDKAVEWINQWDTRIRFLVSGVVRSD